MGVLGPAEAALGPFPAFAPTDALAYSTPGDTSGGSETRLGEGKASASARAPKAYRAGSRGRSSRTSRAGRRPGPAATAPGTSSGLSWRGERGRDGPSHGARRSRAWAAPAGSPAPRSPDRFPAAPHLVTLHAGGGRGAASRRHRPLPSEQETTAAASGPA